MHLKQVLFLCMLLGSLAAYAQERAFFGRVMDKNRKGIAGAVIETVDGNEITQTNSNGVFRFKASLDSMEAIVVTAHGYDTNEVSVDQVGKDSLFIILTGTNNYLKSANVSAKGGKTKIATAGDQRGGHDEGCFLLYKDEIAMYLKADSLKHGILKEVFIYITKLGRPKSEFLLHVYRRDSATGAPGDEITDSILVLSADKGNDWISADLSEKYIQVKGGVFIGLELPLGYVNDYFVYPIKGAKNYYSGDDSLKTVFNGAVMGLCWGGTREQPIVYRRYAHNIYEHTNEDKWFKTQPLRGGNRRGEWITPMMAYTYSYMEH